MTDLLGISSLHRISAALWRRVFFVNKDPRTCRELREMSSAIRYTVISYSVLYAGVMAFFAERIVHALIPYCVRSIVHDLPLMVLRVEARQIDSILLSQTFHFAVLLLCTYSGLRFLTTVFVSIVRGLRKP
jgi:hypothetical protein